ncbi:MAG: ATPase [Muribaculaceae bacterium]|nr:ATPase [Muribaculaceae bacterium]
MKIIADAGSTKVQWATIEDDGSVRIFETPGINALMLSDHELSAAFADALGPLRPDEIFYYGAGCVSPDVCSKVASAFPAGACVEVASDMLGAARALFGSKPGLALILGTGSNSALYNGRELTSNMPPLGFILGDEGSGASFGKRLLRLVYRTGKLRPELERFLGMTYAEILERVYRRPAANAFLASLMPFILDHAEHLSDLIGEELDSLFAAMSNYYKLTQRLSVIGGVAKALAPQLIAAASLRGFTIEQIQERPISGLIAYHNHDR